MSNVKDLKTKRGVLKAQLTRFKTFLDGLDSGNPDIQQLKVRLHKVEDLLSLFENIQLEIEFLEDDFQSNEKERLDFENTYYQLVSKAKVYVEDDARAAESEAQSNRSSGNIHAQGHSIPNISAIKLPTLDLPTFDGTIDDWLFFRDTFNSIIHSNNMPLIQKFHYLRLSLKGEAAEIIKSLEISEANYAIGWNLLLERYENMQILVNNHVKGLFNLPVLTKESSKSLRQLVESVAKHMRSLKVLNQPTENWDTLVIHLVVTKLDAESRRGWQSESHGTNLPTLDELMTFLKNKCVLLETLQSTEQRSKCDSPFRPKVKAHLATNYSQCSLCKNEDTIYNCPQFLQLSVKERSEQVKKLQLCFNCLRKHQVRFCKSSGCRKCQKRHNTLLHGEEVNGTNANEQATSVAQAAVVSSLASRSLKSQVLLSTVTLQVRNERNDRQYAKALLDSGSQSSFISASLCEQLNLKKSKIDYAVTGINQSSMSIKFKVQVNIQSCVNDFSKSIQCLVIPKITDDIPSISFERELLNIPKNITLADPTFNCESKIDLLLGADVFWELLCIGQIKLGRQLPVLQKTQLGWIIAGEIPQETSSRVLCNFVHNVDNQLRRFWEIEELPDLKQLQGDYLEFERHFLGTTKRDEQGRFVVQLPLKQPISNLGSSKVNALKRLYHMEKRFTREPELKDKYSGFLTEYSELNHMQNVPSCSDEVGTFYLPHHCVIKNESLTTKLRVVFDGSAKSSSGYSLNDLQLTGGNIQDDVFSILVRFRQHKIVVAAGITKMYRQILLDERQRSLQRILWRAEPTEEVKCYELKTVTYGLASSSFLAIRCLHQIAEEYSKIYPEAAKIIKRDFYVDDLLTGGKTVSEVELLVNQVQEILNSACFPLNKWVSNDKNLLASLSSSNPDSIINIGDDSSTKTLGLIWGSESGTLRFVINIPRSSQKVTKRVILSIIAQIYDPLGLLSPIVIKAKVILQGLWQNKLTWDESVPQNIHSSWMSFYSDLSQVNEIEFRRWVLCDNGTTFELHGFSDASEVAYGAVIFLRSIDARNTLSAHLLCSKSKVASLKALSIPRLELCGALLLAKLYEKVRKALSLNIDRSYFWCDSTIVLHWINSSSREWKPFVSNRISQIQTITEGKDWQHVSTNENPADLVTRGISPSALNQNSLWFSGPPWLSASQESWPIAHANKLSTETSSIVLKESRDQKICLVSVDDEFNLLKSFSDLNKLLRVTGYCLRFKNSALSPRQERETGVLNPYELENALNALTLLAQKQDFVLEINSLRDNRDLPKSSKLLPLAPFVDEKDILRVGGRLKNSNFGNWKKHPAILSPKNHFAQLLIESEHRKLLHAGPQALLASIRERFWIFSARNLVKRVVRECLTCFKFNCKAPEYLMSDLPKYRLACSRPFYNCGVDYAGPFLIRDRMTRNFKLIKSYIALFVCFSTRAVHLELASDLSTASFLAALRRFISRRGKPLNIHSDNGTNFVGARTEIQTFLKSNHNEFQSNLSTDGINWHLMPPRTPHFGGVWEAGVKSVKYHIKRVIGDSRLTFEEFNTFLTQVESILNSRPMSPLSNDPSDPSPLTPAHFLIGTSLLALPDQCLLNVRENRLTKFQRVQKMQQHFWQRWAKEYVSELQVRAKWRKRCGDLLKPGVLVIVREDNVPPHRWLVGRVVEIHPGSDGVPRVATIRTARGTLKRPAVKLCALPSESH